jgi:hypothetical protein
MHDRTVWEDISTAPLRKDRCMFDPYLKQMVSQLFKQALE